MLNEDDRSAALDNARAIMGVDTSESDARATQRASDELGAPTELLGADPSAAMDYVTKRDDGVQLERMSTPLLQHLGENPTTLLCTKSQLKEVADADEALRSYKANEPLSKSGIQNIKSGGVALGAAGEGIANQIDEAMAWVGKHIPGPLSEAGDTADLTSASRLSAVNAFNQYNAMPKEQRFQLLDQIQKTQGWAGAGEYALANPGEMGGAAVNTLAQTAIAMALFAPAVGVTGGAAAQRLFVPFAERMLAKRVAEGALTREAMASELAKTTMRARIVGAEAGASAGATFAGDIGSEAAGRFADNGGDVGEAMRYGEIKATGDAAVNLVFGGVSGAIPVGKTFGGKIATIGGKFAANAAGGAGGEFAGSAAVGKTSSPMELLLEGLLEGTTMPLDVAVASYATARDKAAERELASKLEDAKQHAESVQKFLTAVNKLDAPNAVPQTFHQLLQHLDEVHGDGVPTELTISAEKLLEIVGQSRIDEARKDSSALDQQFDDALARQGSITLPLADIASHISQPGTEAALAQNLRRTPDDMSTAEAQATVESFGQEATQIAAQHIDNVKRAAEVAKIQSDIFASLENDKRFDSAKNKRDSELVAAFYSTMAHRTNMSPVELFAKMPLRTSNAEANANSLEQDVEHSLYDPMLNAGESAEVKGESGWVYRTVSPQEVEDIRNHGSVRSRTNVDNGKGNRKYWTRGVGGNGKTLGITGASVKPWIRVRESDLKGTTLSSAVEILNDGKFQPIVAQSSYEADLLEQKALDTAAELAAEISGLSQILKHITPEERAKIRRNTAQKLVDLIKTLPSAEEMAAVAHAGSAKRGWYKHSAEALVTVFGPDAPRFAGLLAAMSPQTSVENNLINALNMWKNWTAADRPVDPKEIRKIMGRSVQGKKAEKSILNAWFNNSVRALTHDDFSDFTISGPKVNSFMLNLVGVTEEVTNDAWMANYALVDQEIFGGKNFNPAKRDSGKGAGYIAMNARVREAAKVLTRRTGETWTPAEVQETIWSWAKTLYEMHDAKGETRSPQELLADGALTDDLINATPDFRTLFHDAANQKILADAGYSEQLRELARKRDEQSEQQSESASGKTAPFATSVAERHLRRAAARLGTLREQRLLEQKKNKERKAREKKGSFAQEDVGTNEGRKFKDFFASITSGTAGAPKTSAASVKVLNRERNPEVVDAFMEHSGNFDRHIEASIPGFRDVQFVIADAIVKTYENADVLDIGASEGALVKTVAQLGTNMHVVALDPNPAMAKTFAEKSTVPGAEYAMAALGSKEQEGAPAWTEDDGTQIDYYKPDRKFQVVHEAMVFQFISNERDTQIARVAELLADDGVAIFEEKFIPGEGLDKAEWDANEKTKDAFKGQFFPEDELKAKAESVLVGMNKNMVAPGDFEATLGTNFKYVHRFWKSGNFLGYVASNDEAKFNEMLANIGDTSSPFDGSQDQSFGQQQIDMFNSVEDLEALEKAAAKARGLDMSQEARYSRARKMGFDVDMAWFHATNSSGFTAFKKYGDGKTYGTGVFLTDSRRLASTYMRGLSKEARIGRPDQIMGDPEAYGFVVTRGENGTISVEDPNGYRGTFDTEAEALEWLKHEASFEERPGMYELFVRLNEDNVLTLDWEGKNWSNGPSEMEYHILDKGAYTSEIYYDKDEALAEIARLKELGETGFSIKAYRPRGMTTDEAAREARDMGYEAVRIVNVEDPGPYSRSSERGTVLVVFDPKNIRSTEAAFDPEFDDSDHVLHQPAASQERRGAFHPASLTISQLEESDLSTFLHESGHAFFTMMGNLAAEPGADQGIVDDFNALLKFIDYSGTAAQWVREPVGRQREGHEKVAETFEQYLRTGKAPSMELQPLFQTFAAWLTKVYGALTRQLSINERSALNPEISAVFDRMLATQEAIDQAAEIRGLIPQFESAEQAGMTIEGFAEYQSYGTRTKADAEDSLRSRMMRDMKWLAATRSKILRNLTKESKEKRKAIHDTVTAEVSKMRVYRLMDFLKRGVLLDENGVEQQSPVALGQTKLNKAAVEAMFPALNLNGLGSGKYGMVALDGIEPGVAAGLFGYTSADEMVRDLLSAEPKASLIEGLTDERTLTEHGDISTQQGLQQAADEALANEAHSRMVATELAGLDARVGKVSVVLKAAKYAAMGMLAKRPIRHVRPDLSAGDAARARKASAEALSSGKRDEAAAAKRNEILHLEMQKQGILIKKEVEKFIRSTGRMFKGKSSEIAKKRDLDMVNAARAILAAYGIGPNGAGKAAAQYMLLIANYDGARADDIRSMTAGLPMTNGTTKDFKDLTVDEFRKVADVVNGIYEMAKSEKQVTIDGQKVAINDVASELVQSIIDREGALPPLPGYSSTTSRSDEMEGNVLGALSLLNRVESWADMMGSVWKTYIINPVFDSLGRYKEARNAMVAKYLELLKTIEKDLTYTPIAAPELDGFVFSAGKSEVLHAILHTGNKSNLRKLILGRNWGALDAKGNLDTTKWDAFVARMIAEGVIKKSDFDFAQSVWDLLESNKADAQKAHHAMYGYYFNEVTSDEFVTPFGTYRGGYVPAFADPMSSPDMAQLREKDALLHAGNSFMFPTTGKGFTQARVEFNRPLELDLRVIGQHLDKVARFTYLEPAIRDVGKIINDKRVARALNGYDRTAIGKMINPWLQRTATQTVGVPSTKWAAGDKLSNALRSRTGLVVMFANVVNTLQQVTGFSMAWLTTPAGAVSRANIKMMRGRREMIDFAVSKSLWLKDRVEGQSFEMATAIDKILLNPNVAENARDFLKRNAYFMQQAVQNYMDIVVWTAAYDTAASRGGSDKQSVRAADEAVRLTQGSFAPEDISSFESNIAFVRLFTQFFGYFNMQYNLLRTEGDKALRESGYTEKSKRLAFVWFAGLAIPAFVGALIAQGPPGDDDDKDKDGMIDEWMAMFFGSQGRTLTAMIPVAGQAVNYMGARFDDKVYNDRLSLSPGMSMLEGAGGGLAFLLEGAYNTSNGEDFAKTVKKKNVRDVLTLVGIAAGLPTGVVQKAVGFEMDVEAGKKKPETAVDYAVGYATGK